jgi:hypothetical protein
MHQPTLIETWFTTPNPERSSLFRWGFLGILLLLISFNVMIAMEASPLSPLGWARRLALPVCLLLNHLAFFFPLRRAWLVIMRILAYVGLIFAVIMLFWRR